MRFGLSLSACVRVTVCCTVLAAAPFATVVRAELEPPPEGIRAGPFVIMPSVGLSAAYDTNPFYRNDLAVDENGTPVPVKKDYVTRVLPVIRAVMPFRNSNFELGYQGSHTDYHYEDQPEKWNHVLTADLGLLFSTMDRVTTSVEYTSGLSEVRLFDGGETTYDGVPFTYWTLGLEAERAVDGRRGYRAALAHSALTYDQTQFTFFEFDGNQFDLEYLEPRTPTRFLSASLTVRRFNHYEAATESRSLFRKEESEVVWLGIDNGKDGRLQFHGKLGWGNWRFPGGVGRDYEGLTADMNLVYTRTELWRTELTFERKVWPSFYGDNNYYIGTSVTARFEHPLGPGVQLLANVNWSTLQYDEPFTVGTDDVLRSDRALSADLYATLRLAHRMNLIWGLSTARRTSTEPSVEYRRTAITLGMAWGWL